MSIVPGLAIVGTKLPASLSSLKKSRPGCGVVERAAVGRGQPRRRRCTPGWRRADRRRGRPCSCSRASSRSDQSAGRLGDGRVDLEGQDAEVVAVPVAVRILELGIDRVPGRDLVGLDQLVGLGRVAEGDADVDDVRRLRAGVVLVGLDRLDLVAGAGVGVELVDREAVLGLEAVDDRAVVAPVVGQGDGR